MTKEKSKTTKTTKPKAKAPAKKKLKASEKLGLTMGRPLEFKTPEFLFEKACEYFLWCKENPLQEEKLFNYQGELVKGTINKMRAMTLQGLCIHLNINTQTYRDYKKRVDFIGVTTRIDEIIYDQKFSGAAADMLNANIIARDLGLSDKKEVDNKHKFGDISDDELDEKIK